MYIIYAIYIAGFLIVLPDVLAENAPLKNAVEGNHEVKRPSALVTETSKPKPSDKLARKSSSLAKRKSHLIFDNTFYGVNSL